LLLLNPDTRVTAGALDAMLDAIEADPGVGVVGCRQVDERGRPQLACGRDPTLWREFLRRRDTLGLARGDARAVRRVEGRYAGPSDVDWVTGACLMTRKDVYAELGGMDEAFWLYFEDAEFCRRVRASGRRVVYLPAATIIHLRGAVADTVRPLSGAAYRAGQLAYASKHRGRAGAALARLWCLARSGLAALVPPRGMTRREGRWVAAQLMRLAILGRPSADWRSGPAGVDSPPHRR
jgi:GT2 family glycosyltransferase